MIRLAAILALVAAPALAQPVGPILLHGGVICDTVEQVIAFLDAPAKGYPDGCGRLGGNGVPGMATFLGTYETQTHRWPLARFDFIVPVPFGQVQFGLGGPAEYLGEAL